MNRSTVLHIDDIGDFRSGIESLLNDNGFDVISLPNSVAAKDLRPGDDFDAALLDNAGFQYGGVLRKSSVDIPIIALSRSPEDADFSPDLRLRKSQSDWSQQLLHFLNRRLDVFRNISDDVRNKYLNKILIVSGRPERVVIVADSVEDARRQFASSRYAGRYCRVVQGPVSNAVSLAILESAI
jgi:CheY-like chemotaxis protein